MGTTMKTAAIAVASALLLSQITCAFAQTEPSAGNSPGGGAPSPPAASPSPAPLGEAVRSTTPPANQGTAATGSSGTVGQSRRATRLDDPKLDPIVRETEREVSRRIKSICKGC